MYQQDQNKQVPLDSNYSQAMPTFKEGKKNQESHKNVYTL